MTLIAALTTLTSAEVQPSIDALKRQVSGQEVMRVLGAARAEIFLNFAARILIRATPGVAGAQENQLKQKRQLVAYLYENDLRPRTGKMEGGVFRSNPNGINLLDSEVVAAYLTGVTHLLLRDLCCDPTWRGEHFREEVMDAAGLTQAERSLLNANDKQGRALRMRIMTHYMAVLGRDVHVWPERGAAGGHHLLGMADRMSTAITAFFTQYEENIRTLRVAVESGAFQRDLLNVLAPKIISSAECDELRLKALELVDTTLIDAAGRRSPDSGALSNGSLLAKLRMRVCPKRQADDDALAAAPSATRH